jgi:hypothetical protein
MQLILQRQVRHLLARHPAVFGRIGHRERWMFRGAQYQFKSPPACVDWGDELADVLLDPAKKEVSKLGLSRCPCSSKAMAVPWRNVLCAEQQAFAPRAFARITLATAALCSAPPSCCVHILPYPLSTKVCREIL